MNKKIKITITGGAGYIGGYLAQTLAAKGYAVTVADRKINKKIPVLNKKIKYIESDLSKYNSALNCMKSSDICIHLAARLGGINYLTNNPAEILTQNSLINSSVFKAAKTAKIGRIIYISSGMVFENSLKSLLKESDLNHTAIPNSAYSFSKLEGEKYCHAYHKEFGLTFSIVRLFNVYGPIKRDLKLKIGGGHIVPELCGRIINGEYPLKIIGNGMQTRCFTHIDDAVSGIIRIVEEKEHLNTDFNISSAEKVNIIQLAKLIWKFSRRPGKLKIIHINKEGNVKDIRVPYTQKAAQLLNWRAKIKLSDGLERIIKERGELLNLKTE
jgi:nucleoside-diphosphate-sugar epimerase